MRPDIDAAGSTQAFEDQEASVVPPMTGASQEFWSASTYRDEVAAPQAARAVPARPAQPSASAPSFDAANVTRDDVGPGAARSDAVPGAARETHSSSAIVRPAVTHQVVIPERQMSRPVPRDVASSPVDTPASTMHLPAPEPQRSRAEDFAQIVAPSGQPQTNRGSPVMPVAEPVVPQAIEAQGVRDPHVSREVEATRTNERVDAVALRPQAPAPLGEQASAMRAASSPGAVDDAASPRVLPDLKADVAASHAETARRPSDVATTSLPLETMPGRDASPQSFASPRTAAAAPTVRSAPSEPLASAPIVDDAPRREVTPPASEPEVERASVQPAIDPAISAFESATASVLPTVPTIEPPISGGEWPAEKETLAADEASAGQSASRDSARPGSMRPTEERRGRRPPGQREVSRPRSAQAADPAARQQPVRHEPTQNERPMEDWRRLLFEATGSRTPRGAGSTAPAAASERPAPEPAAQAPRPATPLTGVASKNAAPLLESTRRFLRPRVGIDPATVPIVRGPIADRLADNASADAVAIGEMIVLPSAHDERSPRTLGLLAHELTHVAQRRQPRFVPPVLRAAQSDATSMKGPTSTGGPSFEEGLARRTERAVWNDAQRVTDQGEGGSPSDWNDSVPTVSTRSDVDAGPKPWGNLPAPWEPLSLGGTSPRESAAPASTAPTSSAEQVVHYADKGRALDDDDHAPAEKAAPTDAAPAPDLDALARRVYDVLKRRLAAERRREG